jgi:hypothetical protein
MQGNIRWPSTAKSGELGVLGDISNYFGVVESNGRGLLHLHTLIWIRGNLGFPHLRDRIRAENDFATRVIQYLEIIIMHSIHDTATTTLNRQFPAFLPRPPAPNQTWNFSRVCPKTAIVLRAPGNFTQRTTQQPASNMAAEVKQLVALVCGAKSLKLPRLMKMGLYILLAIMPG